MARRNSKANQSNTEATTEAPVTEEVTMTESTTEAPTETPTEDAPKTEEKAVDLTAFNASVEAAVTAADSATGEVPEEALAEVTAQYRALEGIKAKNEAKKAVNEVMKEAMNTDNLAGARAALNISEKALVAAASGSKSSTPADPTENFVQRVATLTLAYQLAVSNVPEGVDEDHAAKVEAMVAEQSAQATSYFEWTKADEETRGEEPEVHAVVRNAAKLAAGKSAKAGTSRGGGTFTGERRDIGVHIRSAFEDVEEGTFLTVAEIRNKKSEEYGDSLPSAGAISIRLFPKSGESSMLQYGIQPDTQNGKKGAVKTSVPEDDES